MFPWSRMLVSLKISFFGGGLFGSRSLGSSGEALVRACLKDHGS